MCCTHHHCESGSGPIAHRQHELQSSDHHICCENNNNNCCCCQQQSNNCCCCAPAQNSCCVCQPANTQVCGASPPSVDPTSVCRFAAVSQRRSRRRSFAASRRPRPRPPAPTSRFRIIAFAPARRGPPQTTAAAAAVDSADGEENASSFSSGCSFFKAATWRLEATSLFIQINAMLKQLENRRFARQKTPTAFRSQFGSAEFIRAAQIIVGRRRLSTRRRQICRLGFFSFCFVGAPSSACV